MVSCTELRFPDGWGHLLLDPCQTSRGGEHRAGLASGRGLARRRVSNVRTDRVDAAHRVACRADTAGRERLRATEVCSKSAERAPSLSVQLFPARRVSGRRWHRTAHPAHQRRHGGPLRAGRPFVGGCTRRCMPPGTPTRLRAWPWSTLRILSNSRALQKGGRCTNGPGVPAGSKTPSPRLGCVRCESALLAG